MATINLLPGNNLITYYYSTPIAFSTLNPTVNINVIKTPAYDASPQYSNLRSYLPQSSLNAWLTQFNPLSGYQVNAKQAFSYTEAGTPVTPPRELVMTAPWAIKGLDSNRPSVPIAPFQSVLGSNSSIYRVINQGGNGTFEGYFFGSTFNNFNNFEAGQTYYIYASNRSTPWVLTSLRLSDLLLTDSNDFITTEAGDALAA